MIFFRLKQVLFIASLLTLTNAFAGDIYKWTDDQGVVHFGEQPESQNSEKININAGTSPNSDYENRQQNLANQQAADKKKQDEQLQQQQDQAAGQKYQKQVEDACKSYRDNLATLNEKGRRVYSVDSKGNYHYFDDNEREAQIKQLEDQIKTYCTP